MCQGFCDDSETGNRPGMVSTTTAHSPSSQRLALSSHDEFISKINQFQHLLIDPKGLSYYLRRLSAARLSLILGAAFQVERIQNDPNLRGPVQYDKLAVSVATFDS